MSKEYYFDDWSDVDIIKENLNNEELDLLHDILSNSNWIDNRPEDFEWETNNYGCDTGYDLYSEGFFIIETIDKYKEFEENILQILLVQEGWEYIEYLIESTQEIYDSMKE